MNHIKRLILIGTLTISTSVFAGDYYRDALILESEAFMARMEQQREARAQRYEMERQADAMERQADALEQLQRSNKCGAILNLDY